MGSHSEQRHAKVKACAWEDLSGSNGENGLGAVRLEARCSDPMSHHETPELKSCSHTGKAVQMGRNSRGRMRTVEDDSKVNTEVMERMQWHMHAHPVPLHMCTRVQCRGKGKSVGMSADMGLGSMAALSPQELQIRGSLNPPQKLLSYISLCISVTCKSLLNSPSYTTNLATHMNTHTLTHQKYPKNTGTMWHEVSHNHVHPDLLSFGRPAPAQKIPGPKSAPRSRRVPSRSHRPQAVTHYCNLGPEASLLWTSVSSSVRQAVWARISSCKLETDRPNSPCKWILLD